MSSVTWVLEPLPFGEGHAPVAAAVRAQGHRLVEWDDRWWSRGLPRGLGDGPTVFRGALENADRLHREAGWRPGGFCDAARFACSAWYPAAAGVLLNGNYRVMPARTLVERAVEIAKELDAGDRLFVRPDSPLKPFSGRVVDVASLDLRALDFGFYFDDPNLPVVAAPVRTVGREWRFVVADGQVVAGSAYDAGSRSAKPAEPDGDATAFATSVAASIAPPAAVYVLDVCESGGEFRLLELNPFGGADLYACETGEVVRAVSEVADAAANG